MVTYNVATAIGMTKKLVLVSVITPLKVLLKLLLLLALFKNTNLKSVTYCR